MIHCRHSVPGAADAQPALAQAGERLRGRYFMDKVQVDIEDCGGAFLLTDNMSIPDLLKERSWLRSCHTGTATLFVMSPSCSSRFRLLAPTALFSASM